MNWYKNYKYSSFISDFPKVESLYVIRDAIFGLHELNYKYDLINNEYVGMKNKVKRIGWEYFLHCREFIDKKFHEWLYLHDLDDKNLEMSDEDLEEFEGGAVLIKIGRQILVAKERLDKISYSDNLPNMCMCVNLCLGIMHSNGILLVDYGDKSIDLDFLNKLHSNDYYSVWKKEIEEELS